MKDWNGQNIWWLLLAATLFTACYLALDSSCMDWPGGQGCDLKLLSSLP